MSLPEPRDDSGSSVHEHRSRELDKLGESERLLRYRPCTVKHPRCAWRQFTAVGSDHDVWILGAAAILAPRFPRLKEWAYAGMVFVYTGAVASRLAVGDPPVTFIGPIIFTGIVAASWALRPLARRVLVSRFEGDACEIRETKMRV